VDRLLTVSAEFVASAIWYPTASSRSERRPAAPLIPLAFATTTVAPSVTYSTAGRVVVVVASSAVVTGAAVVLAAAATTVVVVASSLLSSSSPPQATSTRPRTATPAIDLRNRRVVIAAGWSDVVGSVVTRVTAGN